MFGEMVQRSEQLFLVGLDSSNAEEILSHLPTFIEALASISAEIQEVLSCFYHNLLFLAI